jgi:hypothetical protein
MTTKTTMETIDEFQVQMCGFELVNLDQPDNRQKGDEILV